MSVHRRQRQGGHVWKVAWRDERGRQKSRTFTRKADADAWEAKIKLAKRQGELADLDAGRQTLKDFLGEWWRLHAEPHLAASTRASYERLRDKHLLPELGHLPLRSITTEQIQRFQADLLSQGVGRESVRRTIVLLQGILERAVEWGRIPRNPARYVRKPRQGRERVIEPLAPKDVERIRKYLLDKKRVRDAALVSVLAYAGLRPGEALALRWGDIRDRTIVIDKAISLGEEKPTKTRRIRSVRLLKPLASDLAAWRLAAGRPDDSALVFPNRAGQPWTELQWRNWRKRRYRDVLVELGVTGAVASRPYDLRHSFASLLFAEQTNAAEVAEQLGHSPQVLLNTYLHVIEDLRGAGRVSAEDEIRAARAAAAKAGNDGVAQKLPKRPRLHSVTTSGNKKVPPQQDFSREPTPRFELGTPSLRVKCSTS